MKRLMTLFLVAGLALTASVGAHAADVKISGLYTFGFSWQDDYKGPLAGDSFKARQRLRTQIDIIANEQIRGVVYFEIGEITWGESKSGGALGADGQIVEVRRSYIDWAPNSDSKIRMGIQGITIPSATALGSLLFEDDVAGVTASYALNDNLAATFMWLRPYDGDNTEDNGNDEMDIFGLILPLSFDGHSLKPYALYSRIGQDSSGTTLFKTDNTFNDDGDAYWLGFAYSMTAFDPFTLGLDFVYGSLDGGDYEKDGFVTVLKAAYALDSMTPALLAWYGSGDNSEGDHGAMPAISALWKGTSIGYRDSYLGIPYDSQLGTAPNGVWALGFEIDDISFVDDLKHLVRFVYYEGTHKTDASNARDTFLDTYLTDKDSAWEVNINSTYNIYSNLILDVGLGYMQMDFDEIEDRSIARCMVTMRYKF